MGRRSVERATLALCIISLAVVGGGETERTAQAQTANTAGAAPDAKKVEEAKRHFQLGLNLLRDPEGEVVEGAYFEFKTAYDLSKSPRILGNIGYCAMRMERNSESVAAYREYEKLVPSIDAAERAQIDQDLVTMTDGAATLTVRYAGTTPWTLIDERVPVKGAMVTNSYGPTSEPLTLLIHPGHHILHLKTGGEEKGRWEVDAAGGSSVNHTFEVKQDAPVLVANPEPERPPVSHTAQFVTIGVGGALLVAGAVTGIAAFAKMKDIERECPGNVCPNNNFHGDVNTARALGTATDTLLIGGAVVVVGGALWLALSRGSRRNDAPDPAAPSVSGACVPGACGLSLRGSF